MMIEDDIIFLESNKNIPTSQIIEDIKDTEKEINRLLSIKYEVELNISMRVLFVSDLKNLIHLREIALQ